MLRIPLRTHTLLKAKNPLTFQKRNFGIEMIVEHTFDIVIPSLAVGTFFASRYRVSKPDQYLVKTGLGIGDINITKKGVQWPFQDYRFIEMKPTNYEFNLHAMSNQKMEFILPGVFTIGPKNDEESLQKYSRYLLSAGDEPNNGSDDESTPPPQNGRIMDDLVKGIIEGETRVLAAQMSIEQIFNDRAAFKHTIIKNVQEELDQFGLMIFNANIKELQETPGSEYFSFLRQKTRSEAEGQARVDTSEAKKKADIGEKEREMETRKQVAEYEASAVEKENETRKRIAESSAELEIVTQDALRRTNIATIEAEKQSAMRDAELQKEVEQRRFEQEVQSYRAADLSKANINAETIRVESDAELYRQQQTAEGIKRIYEANSEGIQRMVDSFGGERERFLQYVMLDKDLYGDLARANAEAIRGLNPKITVWNTGKADEGDYTGVMRNVMQNLPPLLDTIHKQTGLKPADWMVQGLEQENNH